jgi:hypothetical protein
MLTPREHAGSRAKFLHSNRVTRLFNVSRNIQRQHMKSMLTRREHGTGMQGHGTRAILVALLPLLVTVSGIRADDAPAKAKPSAKPAAAAAPLGEYTTERLRGKVVWLDEALKRLYNITSEPDAEKTQVVLEMADGTLWPLVPDTRGRSFVVDERLRNVDLELLVRRYAKAPLIQVIRVLKPTPEGLLEVDYWCDICAIPMYILKPCECCQGETRLRERPLDEVFEPQGK